MASVKRKSLEAQLRRRVRATSDDIEDVEQGVSNDPEISLVDDGSSNFSLTKNDPASDREDNLSLDFSEAESTTQISFGALARAQEFVQRPIERNKSNEKSTYSNDNRRRGYRDEETLERKAGRKDNHDLGRSSKHAPAEVSSKKAVSRKREVIPVIKRGHRDPRFEPLSGTLNESKVRKVYSFLNDYREDEIKELRSAIKKVKDESEKEKLKQALLSLESKKKAEEKKRKEQEILDKHREQEKELVKQGKKPFFLKKSEQRKRLLLDRYSGLKGKQLDRVIERRRKKEAAKEKKKIPWSRRRVEGRSGEEGDRVVWGKSGEEQIKSFRFLKQAVV